MTREQAIEVLDNALYGGGNAFVMSEFRDAIKLALGTLKQERVPEKLVAGQGVKTTGEIIPLPTDDRFNCMQVDDDIQLCGILKDFKPGDKVIVQIRKKQ